MGGCRSKSSQEGIGLLIPSASRTCPFTAVGYSRPRLTSPTPLAGVDYNPGVYSDLTIVPRNCF